jgi:hypothetical protein
MTTERVQEQMVSSEITDCFQDREGAIGNESVLSLRE